MAEWLIPAGAMIAVAVLGFLTRMLLEGKTAKVEPAKAHADAALAVSGAAKTMLDEMTDQIETLQERVACLEGRLSAQDAQIGRLKKRVRDLEAENERLKKRVRDLEEENARLNRENAYLREKVNYEHVVEAEK